MVIKYNFWVQFNKKNPWIWIVLVKNMIPYTNGETFEAAFFLKAKAR